MRSLQRCKRCGADLRTPPTQIDPHTPMVLDAKVPWSMRLRCWKQACVKCGHDTVSVINTAAAVWPSRYLLQHENMCISDVISVVHGDDELPMGRVSVFWAFCPIAHRPGVADQIVEMLRSDQSWLSRLTTTYMVVPAQAPIEALRPVFELFDHVWVVGPDLTADAVGPFPSLRAERSLIRTFGGPTRSHITHIWPSILLPDEGLRHMWDYDVIRRQWLRYAQGRAVHPEGMAAIEFEVAK